MLCRRSPRASLVALATLAGALCAASSALAADIEVSPGQSIVSAINRANPGDRVLVRAGTYPGGGWIERSGTASAPITVLSVDGPRRAIIEGGGETLRVGNSAHMVFDGFEIRGASSNVVHIDSASHHITLRNLYAHDAGFSGDVVKINQSHHITVERSEFARPGPRGIPENPYQECLDFVDVDDSVIRDNFFHDGGSMLLFVKGGSRNNVIERNVFDNQRAGASDPIVGLGGPTDPELLDGELYEAINIVFRNNIVMHGVTGAIAVYDADGAYIANNLLLDNDRVLVEFRAGEGPAAESRNVRVVNNLMVDTRGRMPEPYRRSSHGLRDFTTSHNLFWNNGSAIPRSSLIDVPAQPGHLAVNPLVGAVAALMTDRDAIVRAALPGAGSPAAGAGLDASGAPFFVTDDFAGAARGAAWDRGPWVLSSAPAPVDAGVTPERDAATPIEDSGVVERDSAVPGTDGGSTGRDVVSPQLDASSPDNDAGSERDSGIAPGSDGGGARDAGTDGGMRDPVVGRVGCNAGSDGRHNPGAGDLAMLALFGLALGSIYIGRRR